MKFFYYIITVVFLSMQYCLAQTVAVWGVSAPDAQKIVIQSLQNYQKDHEIKTLRYDAGKKRYDLLDAIDWRQGDKAVFFYRFNEQNAVVFSVEAIDTSLFLRGEEHLIYPKTMNMLKGSKYLLSYGRTSWVQKDETLMSETQARYHTFTLFNNIKKNLQNYKKQPYYLPDIVATPKVNSSRVLPTMAFSSSKDSDTKTQAGSTKTAISTNKSNIAPSVARPTTTTSKNTKSTSTTPLPAANAKKMPKQTAATTVTPTAKDVSMVVAENACPLCKGAKTIVQSKPQRCKICNGKKQITTDCDHCGGKGKVGLENCSVCAGRGKKQNICIACGGVGFGMVQETVTCVYCSGRGTK